MIVVYNPIGLVICFVPAVIVCIAAVYVPRIQDYWTFVGLWGVVVVLWDSLVRFLNDEFHWLDPRRGGHLFFVPVCILGALGWYIQRAVHLGYWLPPTTPFSQPP